MTSAHRFKIKDLQAYMPSQTFCFSVSSWHRFVHCLLACTCNQKHLSYMTGEDYAVAMGHAEQVLINLHACAHVKIMPQEDVQTTIMSSSFIKNKMDTFCSCVAAKEPARSCLLAKISSVAPVSLSSFNRLCSSLRQSSSLCRSVVSTTHIKASVCS